MAETLPSASQDTTMEDPTPSQPPPIHNNLRALRIQMMGRSSFPPDDPEVEQKQDVNANATYDQQNVEQSPPRETKDESVPPTSTQGDISMVESTQSHNPASEPPVKSDQSQVVPVESNEPPSATEASGQPAFFTCHKCHKQQPTSIQKYRQKNYREHRAGDPMNICAPCYDHISQSRTKYGTYPPSEKRKRESDHGESLKRRKSGIDPANAPVSGPAIPTGTDAGPSEVYADGTFKCGMCKKTKGIQFAARRAMTNQWGVAGEPSNTCTECREKQKSWPSNGPAWSRGGAPPGGGRGRGRGRGGRGGKRGSRWDYEEEESSAGEWVGEDDEAEEESDGNEDDELGYGAQGRAQRPPPPSATVSATTTAYGTDQTSQPAGQQPKNSPPATSSVPPLSATASSSTIPLSTVSTAATPGHSQTRVPLYTPTATPPPSANPYTKPTPAAPQYAAKPPINDEYPPSPPSTAIFLYDTDKTRRRGSQVEEKTRLVQLMEFFLRVAVDEGQVRSCTVGGGWGIEVTKEQDVQVICEKLDQESLANFERDHGLMFAVVG